MSNILKLFVISVIVGALLVLGCGDDGNGPVDAGEFNVLTLDFYSVTPLEAGYLYRLWSAPAASGLAAAPSADWVWLADFNVSPAGEGLPMDLTTPEGQDIADNQLKNLPVDLLEYDSLFVTIEQAGSSTEMPSSTVFLGGSIPETLEHDATSAFEFASAPATGSENFFELVTPTDDVQDNDTSGVWFIRGFPPSFNQGLSVAVAPEGWLYEGWVWHDGIWLSTGKFSDPGTTDDFSNYSGTANPAPGFPGEDFLNNAPGETDFPWVLVSGDTVAISLEPSPDPNDEQFGTRLLQTILVGVPLPVRAAHSMGVVLGEFAPSAVIVFERSDLL